MRNIIIQVLMKIMAEIMTTIMKEGMWMIQEAKRKTMGISIVIDDFNEYHIYYIEYCYY